MTEKMTETISIRVTPSMKAALQDLADADRRKLSAFISIVLEEYVEAAKAPKKAKP
jgi:predicted transcriptional regulator